MSVTYSSSTVSGEAAAYGGFVDALGGIATIVLAIIGLAGIRPEVLVSIATVVFGAALLIQGGAMLSELAQIEQLETTSDANVTAGGGGLSTLFLVGVAGIVLGVLALLGVHTPMLTAIAAIGFGAALVISSAAVWQLLASRSVAMRFRGRSPAMRVVAAEVASGSAGVQAIAGLAALVLGILAVCGITAQPLTLIALLVAGAAILLTGSTLSATMIGFMRSSAFTASTRTG